MPIRSPLSFVAAMRDTVREAFETRGDTVTVSDLYAMGFNPVLSAADFEKRERPGHLAYALEQRHASGAGTLARDMRTEVEHVLAADLLAFTFPVFWLGPPAILKGWIERVFCQARSSAAGACTDAAGSRASGRLRRSASAAAPTCSAPARSTASWKRA